MSNNTIEKIISPVRDYTPITSAIVLQEFIFGSIHKDFLEELYIRIEAMRDFNEECTSKEYLETRGGIKALRMVAGIFGDMCHNKLTEIATKDEETKNG